MKKLFVYAHRDLTAYHYTSLNAKVTLDFRKFSEVKYH